MFGDLCVPRIDEVEARPVTHFVSQFLAKSRLGLAPILPNGHKGVYRMNKTCLLLLSVTGTLALVACARGPRPMTVSPACAGVADSVSKYVSVDALPFAHIIGTPRVLPVPPTLRRGDSVTVEFLVRPDGVADPASVQITGSNDQAFSRDVLRFVTESRFIPATVTGCNVPSKYNLIIKPAA